MITELFKVYRPRRFTDILGQDEAVKILSRMVKKGNVPRSILFSGPSGTGKTSLARVLATKLGCRKHDLEEINIADLRGIDTIRDIRSKMTLNPLGGKAKIWILDECQTMRGESQNALLKILEDENPNSKAHIMLCTTEPGKLIKAIRTRCTDIKTKCLDSDTMECLILGTCKKEKKKVHSTVLSKLVETADGSPRKALVLLNSVLELDTRAEQLNFIENSDSEKQTIELCRLLLKPGCTWDNVRGLLKQIEDEPESIRRMVLGYVNAVILNGGLVDRCIRLIDCFSSNYYDSGKAGLSWSCYMACQKRR